MCLNLDKCELFFTFYTVARNILYEEKKNTTLVDLAITHLSFFDTLLRRLWSLEEAKLNYGRAKLYTVSYALCDRSWLQPEKEVICTSVYDSATTGDHSIMDCELILQLGGQIVNNVNYQ